MAGDTPADSPPRETTPATDIDAGDQVDPHLALIRDAMDGNRKIILILVVAVLFGQSVTAILSGASLAAELGAFKVYSLDENRNTTHIENAGDVDELELEEHHP